MSENRKIGKFDIRTEDGMKTMLEELAKGYPEYDGTPFTVTMLDERRNSLGMYLIAEHEIQLYSLSEISDISLMEVAFHEMAHHIDTCINGGTCSFHSRQFYRIFFNLLARADETGIAGYEDISKIERYLRKMGKFGRPHDIQVMEHYYGRPDGKPVDRNLLKKELEDRKRGRESVSIEKAKARKEEEEREQKERETMRRLEKQKKELDDLYNVFGWPQDFR